MFENKRMELKYRDRSGLAVYQRFLSDEEMREYEQLLARDGTITDHERRRVMLTLKRMQGIADADAAPLIEALERLTAEMQP